MSLKEQLYSVLVVSASENFNTALVPLLPVSHFQPIRFASGISTAKRLANERSFDLVIINSPLPDDIGNHVPARGEYYFVDEGKQNGGNQDE